MSVNKYREVAADSYFKSLYIIRKYIHEGDIKIFELIKDCFKDPNDFYTCDSGLFAAKSILDGLTKEEKDIKFIDFIMQNILNNPMSQSNRVLARGSASFINEMSMNMPFLNI